VTVADLFAPYPGYDDKPVRQLLELAWNQRESLSRRASAVASLGRRTATDPAAVEALESIATDGTMRETRMFHLTSLAYLAVAGLVNGRTEQSVGAARRALAEFDDADRESLMYFLRTGGLPVP
jgi:hypothetical protein